MSIETATYVDSLDTANPLGTDSRSSADDHARLIKASLRRTFPAIAGQVSASHGEMNFLRSASVAIQAQIDVIKSGSYSVTYAKSVGYALSAKYAVSTSMVAYADSAGHAANAGEAASASLVTGVAAKQSNLAHVSTTWTLAVSLTLTLEASAIYRVEFGGFDAFDGATTATVSIRLYGINGEPVPGGVVWRSSGHENLPQTFGANDPTITATYNQIFTLEGWLLTAAFFGVPYRAPSFIRGILETSASFKLGVQFKGPLNTDYVMPHGYLSAIKIGTR